MIIDFVWMSFVGVTLLGYTEREVGHFTIKKWSKLYEFYKRYHNMKVTNSQFETQALNEDEVYESYEWFDD